MLKTAPAVFAVGNEYQIMAQVENESLFWVKIGNKNYYDESNGVMNSLSGCHRAVVPMNELESTGEYTVCVKPIVERKPYGTETEETVEKTFKFYPVPKNDIRVYCIADAHNKVSEPVKAAKTFGRLDALILNGDILDYCGDSSSFEIIYEICSMITGGSIPIVFSRGNHDLRGKCAEFFANYTPNRYGSSYYTFRLGSIWGMVVDCGEDKNDDHPEYGFTVACHQFRKRQTDYIKRIIANAHTEYAEKGVKTRLIISHNPFAKKAEAPFDIERDIYSEWAVLIKEHIKPHLMICGHTHKLNITAAGSAEDIYGISCPIVEGSRPLNGYFAGCGFVFKDGEAEVVFTDSNGETLCSQTIKFAN